MNVFLNFLDGLPPDFSTPMEYLADGLFSLAELESGFESYPKDAETSPAKYFENEFASILVFPGSAAFVNPKKGWLTNWARIGVSLPVFVKGYRTFMLRMTCCEAFFKFLSGVFTFCTAENLADEDKARRDPILNDMASKILKATSPKQVKQSSFACPKELFNQAIWDGPDSSDGKQGLAYECMVATLLFKLADVDVFKHFMGLFDFLSQTFNVKAGSIYFAEFKEDRRWGAGMNNDEAVSLSSFIYL